MWAAWGKEINFWIDEKGFIRIGGRLETHDFQPIRTRDPKVDELIQNLQSRVQVLPIHWELGEIASGARDDSFLNRLMRPLPQEKPSTVITKWEDIITVSADVLTPHFRAVEHTVHAYCAAPGEKHYRLNIPFNSLAVEEGLSHHPTYDQFLNKKYPYWEFDPISISLCIGKGQPN